MSDLDERANSVLVEYFECLDRGELVRPEELMQQHPELIAQLEEFFAAAELVQRMAGPTVSESTAGLSAERTVRLGSQRDEQPGAGAGPIGALPNRFGRYRVQRLVGRGAMGEVYLAHDTQLHRDVAIKIPRFQQPHDAQLLERFYREARAAATLRHPHICPVYDVDQIDGVHYLAMAYIEGQPLSQQISGKRTPRQIAELVFKLASALQRAHEQGIVHRDIKPSNIMLDGEGEPILMDFGLARRLDQDEQMTQSGVLIGSPAYMSPEQITQGPGELGPPTDIYSLGVVLYELLAGQRPYRGSILSVLSQIAAGQAVPPEQVRPDVDPQLAAICRKMIAPRVQDRHRTMAEVALSLKVVLDREPGPAGKPPGDMAHDGHERDRSLLWMATGCASVLALLCGLFILAVVLVFMDLRRGTAGDSGAPAHQAPPSASAAAAPVKQPEQKSLPAAEAVGAAPDLRYGWQAGKGYTYAVEIEAEYDNMLETLTGNPVYHVEEVYGDEARLSFSGSLHSRRSVKSGIPFGSHFFGPRVFSPFRGITSGGPARGHVLFLNERGRVKDVRGDSQLPFLLGNLSLLVIEPLPEEPSASWTVEQRVTVEFDDTSLPFRDPFQRFHRGTDSIDADQKTSFTIQSFDDDQAVVDKTYSLTTSQSIGGRPRIAISGTGQFTFDRRRQLTVRGRARMQIVSQTRSAQQPTVVRIDYRLLSEEELEQLAREAEEKRPKPLNEEERPQLLADLASSDAGRISAALARLERSVPEGDLTEVATAIAAHLDDADPKARSSALNVLALWATTEQVPELLKGLDHSDTSIRWTALRTLGRLADPRSVEAVAAHLSQSMDRNVAAQALEQFGSVAEPAVLPYLTHQDEWVRATAAGVLAEVGSEASSEALKKAATDDTSSMVRSRANSALQEIRGKQPPGPPVSQDTPLSTGTRLQANWGNNWYDVEVLEVLEDGRVKIRWIGWSSNWDEVVPRAELRLPQAEG